AGGPGGFVEPPHPGSWSIFSRKFGARGGPGTGARSGL
ncbi:MAG: hypothetical protein AVDCRST_MAG02-556, partial [uncultured Rubrobacteraceae bacterium]